MSEILRVDPRAPEPALIGAAARAVREGRAVVFPTAGLYGLGADALDDSAVDRVFCIKQRPADKPVLVLVSRVKDVTALVRKPAQAR